MRKKHQQISTMDLLKGHFPGDTLVYWMFLIFKKIRGQKIQENHENIWWQLAELPSRWAQPVGSWLNPAEASQIPLSWRALGRYYTWPNAKGTNKYDSDAPRVGSSWYFDVFCCSWWLMFRPVVSRGARPNARNLAHGTSTETLCNHLGSL